jgi:hypothetical protein
MAKISFSLIILVFQYTQNNMHPPQSAMIPNIGRNATSPPPPPPPPPPLPPPNGYMTLVSVTIVANFYNII